MSTDFLSKEEVDELLGHVTGAKDKPRYHTIIASRIVKPVNEPIFSELATTVSIAEEDGGAFVEVSQHGRIDMGKIAISVCEWEELQTVIDKMIFWCKENRNG